MKKILILLLLIPSLLFSQKKSLLNVTSLLIDTISLDSLVRQYGRENLISSLIKFENESNFIWYQEPMTIEEVAGRSYQMFRCASLKIKSIYWVNLLYSKKEVEEKSVAILIQNKRWEVYDMEFRPLNSNDRDYSQLKKVDELFLTRYIDMWGGIFFEKGLKYMEENLIPPIPNQYKFDEIK